MTKYKTKYKVDKDEVEEVAGSVERELVQVQEAEEGERKGAEGRGRGVEGVGEGLRSRIICAHHLLAGSRDVATARAAAVVSEAHLVHARRVAPRRDACAAVHRQPPARASPSSLPRAARSQPARLPTGRLRVARTHTAQHPAAPLCALL